MPKNHAPKSPRKKTEPGFHGRVWIDGPEGTFIGHGRVVLLGRIMEHGSITRAAKSMKMAYRRAWDLVDSMNRQAKEPFVELATGEGRRRPRHGSGRTGDQDVLAVP